MKCGRCGGDLSAAGSACPVCGGAERAAGVFQTSTVLISEGGAEHRYHTVEEAPARLRAMFRQSTHGANSATILIADQRGRQEIAGLSPRLPPGILRRLRPAPPGGGAAPAPPNRRARFRRVLALGAILTAALLVAVAAFSVRWR
jgi:hypothetical protein